MSINLIQVLELMNLVAEPETQAILNDVVGELRRLRAMDAVIAECLAAETPEEKQKAWGALVKLCPA